MTYNISDYFVGSGEYYDGTRSADHLREAALVLSVAMFFLTAIGLIVAALLAAGAKSLMILTVALVGFDVLLIVVTSLSQSL